MTVAGGAGRYDDAEVAVATVRDADGTERQVRYLRQPQAAPPTAAPSGRTPTSHRVVAGDRLDTVTARYLGDPLAYWQVADANLVFALDDLIGPAAEGLVLEIPTPGV
ncbi:MULTISPECIES: hypothetical protein [unclassified Streptomyces]|uniref:hypothetical protein n=1 Tax=unclassified Streptomyces TaxID=2593676 RepID=UPI0032564E57